MNYFISYPRSGNTVVRYCIEKITNKKTLDCGRYDMISKKELSGDVILQKEHKIVMRIEDIDKLILSIRNYKDVYISHVLRKESLDSNLVYERLYKDAKWWGDTLHDHYYSLIDFYENFKGEKLLIYFEDLIENSFSEIKKIIDFLEKDNNYIFNESDIEKWSNESKDNYKIYNGIKTEKIKILHSIMSAEQNKEIDNKFRSYNEKLYDKYLLRYKIEF